MQFPWMMYRKGPGLGLPHGQSVSCRAALDETEYAEAIKAGWLPSVPEALAEKLDAPDQPAKAEEIVPAEIPQEDEEPVEEDEPSDESEPDEAPEGEPPGEDEPDIGEAPKRGKPRKS